VGLWRNACSAIGWYAVLVMMLWELCLVVSFEGLPLKSLLVLHLW
jgi:hypothetical protein